MCLEKLYNTPPQSEGIGWKIVKINSTDNNMFYPIYQRGNFRFNEWIQNKFNVTLIDEEYDEYQCGFHIFQHKHEAEKWLIEQCPFIVLDNLRVVKTKYKNANAHGLQWGCKVIVAQEIFVENNNGNSTE